MSETPDRPVDSRDGGQGPSDVPDETVSSESDLALSEVVEERRRKGEQDT